MIRWLFDLVQNVLRRFGLRIVRWPRQLVAQDAQRSVERFFPVGEIRPWHIPDDLRAISTPWARTLVEIYEDGASWPSSIVPEGGMLLQALVRNICPRVIVETGTCLGVSTIWLASALRMAGGSAVHSFDLFLPPRDTRQNAEAFQNPREYVEDRLRDAGVAEMVTLHEGDSAANIAAIRDELSAAGGVQFAFIDGDHSPRGVLADLQALEPVLPVGAYVFLHDIFPEVSNQLGPRWLLDHLHEVSEARYQVCELYLAQTNYGAAVIQRVE